MQISGPLEDLMSGSKLGLTGICFCASDPGRLSVSSSQLAWSSGTAGPPHTLRLITGVLEVMVSGDQIKLGWPVVRQGLLPLSCLPCSGNLFF